MKKYGITRREWLAGASCLGLSMIPACTTQAPRFGPLGTESFPRNAAEGLLRLKAGNRRFMADRPIHTHENASWRHQLV
jgi:carbonic anhydrase